MRFGRPLISGSVPAVRLMRLSISMRLHAIRRIQSSSAPTTTRGIICIPAMWATRPWRMRSTLKSLRRNDHLKDFPPRTKDAQAWTKDFPPGTKDVQAWTKDFPPGTKDVQAWLKDFPPRQEGADTLTGCGKTRFEQL